MSDEGKQYNILVTCTGSVASVKLPHLITELQNSAPEGNTVDIRMVTTENALHFVDTNSLPTNIKLYRDQDEWNSWKKMGDPVLHIELRRWADILVIAPLDANTLAKISGGLCDNLLTCIVRAWDVTKPLVFCPAMNTFMWDHPLTGHQISILKQFGYEEVSPISKTLACGDTGMGAMASVQDIARKVWQRLLNMSV